MANIILCNISDHVQVVEEARLDWTLGVLEALGVPDKVFDASYIRDFRYDMEEFGIEVELCTNGNVNIYKKVWHEGNTEQMSGWLPVKEEHLVAQWKEPKFIRKIEGKEVYYEVHLNEWSILNIRK